MHAPKTMKIGTKLTLSFVVVMALMFVISLISVLAMREISGVMKEGDRIQRQQLDRLYVAREALDQTGIAARNAFVFRDEQEARKELDIVDKQKAIYLDALQAMEPHLAGQAGFRSVKAGLLKMAEELRKPRALREAGKMQEYADFLVNECSPLRRQIVADIDRVLNDIKAKNDSTREAAMTDAEYAIVKILALSAIALLCAVTVAVWITKNLLTQLGGEPAYAKEIANRIAEGDLSIEVQTKANDDSSLLFAIKTMRASLADIVEQVRAGTHHIELASSEIAAGNMDLSGRTEQQASALQETASAMDQLTATVKQNADNANQANALASVASKGAQDGGVAVNQVIDTMRGINASSQKIVEIISVIDTIAFQTNILALNAAVEAARAGEQGRGFAVVASEVRGLAQRSATAAKEIQALIQESVAQVESGNKFVTGAGETIKGVINGFARVADVIEEITVASQEQSDGIGQVNLAITQMDQATQQNSALVEEAAATAKNLEQEAASLAALVSKFKI